MAKIEAIGLAWDAIVELAKRSRGGDQNAASEVAKYGGEGRILDQYGDPRSMDMSNLDAAPDVPQFDLERYNPPRGRPPNLDPLLTPETAGRMEEYAVGGRKSVAGLGTTRCRCGRSLYLSLAKMKGSLHSIATWISLPQRRQDPELTPTLGGHRIFTERTWQGDRLLA